MVEYIYIFKKKMLYKYIFKNHWCQNPNRNHEKKKQCKIWM